MQKESFYPFVQYLKEKTQNGTQGLELNEIYKAFELLNYFRILCSNRNGPLGQNILNELISNQVFLRSTIKSAVKLTSFSQDKL